MTAPEEAGGEAGSSAGAANLLRDRFQLATHLETRELPVFHLVLARSDGRLGPELTRTPVGCQATIAERQEAARRGAPPPPLPANLFDPKARPCGVSRVDSGVATGTGQTLAQISSTLSDLVGRTVIDKTGLWRSWSSNGSSGRPRIDADSVRKIQNLRAPRYGTAHAPS